jgi:hypothetical protein
VPKVIRESLVEAGVVRFCKRQGLYCRKLTSPGSAGIPDRLIAGHGKVLFLEIKRPGGKPTSLQQYEIDLLTKAGVYATWCDNLQSAIEIISDHFVMECI